MHLEARDKEIKNLFVDELVPFDKNLLIGLSFWERFNSSTRSTVWFFKHFLFW